MTDELAKVREACEEAHREAWGVVGVVSDGFVAALAKRLQPKPEKPREPAPVSLRDDAKWLAERVGGSGEGWGAWEDWLRSVVRRHRWEVPADTTPEPPKKVWSVSGETLAKFNRTSLNSVAADIIRERPDLVAAEWGRRYRISNPKASESWVKVRRDELFPELDPK